MLGFRVLAQYFFWHYTRAFADLMHVWANICWFLWNFFSIGLLTRTLFSPWQRIRERRRSGFDLEELLSVIIVNTLMRLVGFVMRTILIVVGLVVICGWVVFGVAMLIAWTCAPFAIVLLIGIGILWIA